MTSDLIMRTPLIVANWKMNHTIEESLKFATYMEKDFPLFGKVETVICPPHTALYSLSVVLTEHGRVKLGAQNCHWEDHGAFTGEVSPVFLKELNCEYVIIGHSERRQLFGETDEVINKKLQSVLENEMTPIFCIGETEEERKSGKTTKVVTAQLSKGLEGISTDYLSKLVIAYEPVWAIGTGNNATADEAQEVHKTIRNWYTKQAGDDIARKTRILYGGSVKPDNIGEFMKKPDIDGALVGGASLKVDSFLEIVNYDNH